MSDEQLLIGFDLAGASLAVLEVLCDDAEDGELFQEIYRANIARTEVLKLLYDHPDTPEELMREIAAVLQIPPKEKKAPLPVPIKKTKAAKEAEEAEENRHKRAQKAETLLHKIGKLTVGERVHLAMKGGKEIRSILLKDSSKEVVKKVLENPRMTDSEVELISKSRSVTEDALRIIAKKKEWMKNYSIMTGIVTNPKTPGGIAMQFVKNLKVKDLALIEKNRNVSEAVRSTAKKILRIKKPR
jgi:tRNA nucleotidyltransferase/poly(A) polymerase